jgi:hypothetical protein
MAHKIPSALFHFPASHGRRASRRERARNRMDEQLRAARGIFNGLILGAVFWALLIAALLAIWR